MPSMSAGFFDLLSLLGFGFPSANVSSQGLFDFTIKDGRAAVKFTISNATRATDFFASYVQTDDQKAVSAGNVKACPGVTAGETITIWSEVYASSVSGNRAVAVELRFYNDSAVQKGSTQIVTVPTAGAWHPIETSFTVPTDATRVNVTMALHAGAGETISAWFSGLRLIQRLASWPQCPAPPRPRRLSSRVVAFHFPFPLLLLSWGARATLARYPIYTLAAQYRPKKLTIWQKKSQIVKPPHY